MNLVAYDTEILDILRARGLFESAANPTASQVENVLKEHNIKGVVRIEGDDLIVKRLLVDSISSRFQKL